MSPWLQHVSTQLDLTRLAHAYVIEGIGRHQVQEVANALAMALLCKNRNDQDMEPCGTCHSCELFRAGNHPDLLTLGLEGNSVGVDEVRQISTLLSHTAQMGAAQVVVVNQAQKMTENAANAILKTLEEPSSGSYLFLLVQNRSQLMPTIRSRCQFISLPKISREQLKSQFSDIPEYVFGFVGDDLEQVENLVETGQVDSLNITYNNFIQSLKTGHNQMGSVEAIAKSDWFEPFVLYLMQRRARQLMLKRNNAQAMVAINAIGSYQQAVHSQAGLNKPLALTNLLNKVLPNLR